MTREECKEFVEDGKPFYFKIYKVPFNDGAGGEAVPLEGASEEGVSNYFPKYSPDGKWIVFCKSSSYMLLRGDSKLYIMPASGGIPRLMRCNTDEMNSWHSWSPNGKWLVFSSKRNGPYTQLWLTHIDVNGESTPPVVLDQFTAADRAANIPEFVNAKENIVDCYAITGEYDYQLRLYARDITELESILLELKGKKCVSKSHTIFVLMEHKHMLGPFTT